MTDRPILFSGPMVRAILEGRKTQTRRVLKPQPHIRECYGWHWRNRYGYEMPIAEARPYAPGDRLWVREALRPWSQDHELLAYAADDKRIGEVNGETDWPASLEKRRNVSPIHMPRWVSRITLIVESVRVERVQDISEADAIAEGATSRPGFWEKPDWSMDWSEIGRYSRHKGAPLEQSDIALGRADWAFASYWNEIHGHRAWDANPWVAAITFRPILANIDSPEGKP